MLAATPLIDKAQMLDPTALCSPTLAQHEDVKIWLRDWVCVGFGQQIPEPADLLPAPVSGFGLHVQRQLDGSLRAAFNYRRLGIVKNAESLCSAVRREINCPQISCPYSWWAVRADAIPGSAEATPEIAQFIGFNPERLVSVKAEEWPPLIFLNIGLEESVPLSQQLDGLGDRLADYGLAEMVLADRFWFDLDCNWKLASAAIVEALGGAAWGGTGAPDAGPRGLWVEGEIDKACIPALGLGRLDAWTRGAVGELAPLTSGWEGASRCYLVFPNLVLVLFRNHALAVVVRPAYFDTSIALAGILVRPESAAGPDLEESAMAELSGLWREIASDAVRRSGQWDREEIPVPSWPILEMAFHRVHGT